MSVIDGLTVSVSASSATDLMGPLNFGTGAARLVVRAMGAGVYIGNSGVSGPSTGFLLVADREYTFDLNVAAQAQGSSSDFRPYVYNSTGGSVDVTCAITAL